MRLMYIHEHKDWPKFTWDQASLTDLLAEVRHNQGRLLGRMESLGFRLREEATLKMLTAEVLTTCEIEGEKLDPAQVRSSLATKLGLDVGAVPKIARNVEGIVEVTLDATRKAPEPLTSERLFGWHSALFPTGRSGMQRVTIGAWRTQASGAMRVVSGAYGHERIHFEAPTFDRLDREMAAFLTWFNGRQSIDLVVASAIAHFRFVTIHPFDDGNGLIARAIADMMLARSDGTAQRFYSMSTEIQRDRSGYYDVLERRQKGTLDITEWIDWYLTRLGRAIAGSAEILENVLAKARFWKAHEAAPLNERQRMMLTRLLDGFEGKLTSSKWAKLMKCSQDTALRDVTELVELKILAKESAGGRSTSYVLCPHLPAPYDRPGNLFRSDPGKPA